MPWIPLLTPPDWVAWDAPIPCSAVLNLFIWPRTSEKTRDTEKVTCGCWRLSLGLQGYPIWREMVAVARVKPASPPQSEAGGRRPHPPPALLGDALWQALRKRKKWTEWEVRMGVWGTHEESRPGAAESFMQWPGEQHAGPAWGCGHLSHLPVTKEDSLRPQKPQGHPDIAWLPWGWRSFRNLGLGCGDPCLEPGLTKPTSHLCALFSLSTDGVVLRFQDCGGKNRGNWA